MAKTIIQTIGPLYGEAINGTVFGRPNGSIYVPAQNTINLSIVEESRYVIKAGDGSYYIANSAGSSPWGVPAKQVNVVAESQDLQNAIVFEVSTSADFATVIGQRQFSAGQFNTAVVAIAYGPDLPAIEDEGTYYLRAVLVASTNEPVATSSTIELEGVVL